MHVPNQLFLFLQLKPTCWLFEEDDLERQYFGPIRDTPALPLLKGSASTATAATKMFR
jgi:hypothetical protein